MVPVPVAVQPCAENQTGAERDQTEREGIAVITGTVITIVSPDKRRIVLRYIDDLRFRGFDSNHIGLVDDYQLLRVALKDSRLPGFGSQTLDRSLHVRSLNDIGLSKSRGPIRVLCHVVQNDGVVSDCLNADIPRLSFNQTLVYSAVQHLLSI